MINEKAISSALNTAKAVANRVSPGAGSVSLPKVGQPVPLMRATGGPAVNFASMFSGPRGMTPTPKPAQVVDDGRFPTHPEGSHTIKTLAAAFDRGLKHHLSLSPEEQRANGIAADKALEPYVGEFGDRSSLLSKNGKMMKAEKGVKGAAPIQLPDGRGVETAGLTLAPAFEEGKFTTCPNSQSCKEACIGKTNGGWFRYGGGNDLEAFKGPRLRGLKKTQAMLRKPEAFAVRLHREIEENKTEAAARGNLFGMRLNTLSDINPQVHKALIAAHPDVAFYDYTKNNSEPIAQNHHYTYSSTGATQPGVVNSHQNWKAMRRRLDQGHNVAMSFSHKKELPEELHDEETGITHQVVDGDQHDFRPFEYQSPDANGKRRGVIVGLKNKADNSKTATAVKDSKGFFVHYDPKMENGAATNRRAVMPVQPTSRKIIDNDEAPEVKPDV